jgi:hypothetical protein
LERRRRGWGKDREKVVNGERKRRREEIVRGEVGG